MQDAMLTIRNLLRNNWLLISPLQYPPATGAAPTADRTGVTIETETPYDIRARLMITVETREAPRSIRPVSDLYWEHSLVIEVKVWNRAQTFNAQAIEQAKQDRSTVRDEIEKIIHANQFNPLFEDDGVTIIPSWMWIEHQEPRDVLDRGSEGMEYPLVYNVVRVHIMFLRRTVETVSAEIVPPPAASWDVAGRTWDDGLAWWQ